jgi:dUTP pyrophosphatase
MIRPMPNDHDNAHHIPVAFKRLPHGHDLPLPTYQTPHSAAVDLHAAVGADVVLPPGQVRLIPCGFAMAIPPGYECQIRPRSGLAAKFAISMPNTPGTIDADYRGEIMVPLINLGQTDFTVTRAMRIAQMLIAPVLKIAWLETDDLSTTTRGSGGFGHTGH